jgi:hypothetical protein
VLVKQSGRAGRVGACYRRAAAAAAAAGWNSDRWEGRAGRPGLAERPREVARAVVTR